MLSQNRTPLKKSGNEKARAQSPESREQKQPAVQLPGNGSEHMKINGHATSQILLPYPGCVVTATVQYVQFRHVEVQVHRVDGARTCKQPGIIHREDAAYGMKDEVNLNEMFVPGDLVHGRVLSLGHTGELVITTADAKHGVVRGFDWETKKPAKISNGKLKSTGNAEKDEETRKRKLAAIL